MYWPSYPSEHLYVKHTGHETHNKLLPLLGQHLASRAIKQLYKQITTAILNIGRHYNT